MKDVASKLPAHLPRLDVLRAVAILMVFFHHYMGEHFNAFPAPWKGLGRDYASWPHHGLGFYFFVPFTMAWSGVCLFFVLSGFCIHYAYLRRPERFTISSFYWRRFVRIYPAYLAALLGFVFLYKVVGLHIVGNPTGASVFAHLFLVHNLFSSSVLGINSDFWSLAVEFQFYLLYPLLIVTRSALSLQRWLFISLGLGILIQMLDGVLGFFSHASTGVHHFLSLSSLIPTNLERGTLPIDSVLWCNPFTTWSDWILGACLAEAYASRKRLFKSPVLILCLSFALFLVSDNFKYLHWQSYLFGSVFFAALMDWYLSLDLGLVLLERLFVPLGIVSYSFYLWHDPLIAEITHFFRVVLLRHLLDSMPMQVVSVGLTFALILPVAVISYFVFERGLSGALRNVRAKLRAPVPSISTHGFEAGS